MADKNIVIKSRNGSTWDNIYPVTKSGNVIMGDSTTLEAKIATKQNNLGFTPENTTNKNKANGYAGLDVNSKILSSQLPSIAFSSLTSKPTTLSGYGITDAATSGHSHSAVTTGAAGFMSAEDKVKLNGIAASANNYVHPANHPASIITQDTSNRFVTDAEKTTWSAKASTAVATASANGLMSKEQVNALANKFNSTGKTQTNGFLIADTLDNTSVWWTPDGTNYIVTLRNHKGNERDVLVIRDAADTSSVFSVKGNGNARLSNEFTAKTLVSTAPNGTPPIKVTSPTRVDNLNPELHNGWRQYSSLSELGLTDISTWAEIFNALPVKSRLNFVTGSNTVLFPAYTVTVEVVKPDSTKMYIRGTRFTDTSYGYHEWTGNYHTSQGIALRDITDLATTSANGLMSSADKVKLNGIATSANNYVHPANHPASIITQDASNRFVTDAEKTTWSAKASTAVVTTSANGLMLAADKTKLNGIAASANNYVHPTNHPASIITQDESNRFVTDAEKTTWSAKASTAVATTSVNGLMLAGDKVKLNGIATGAQVNRPQSTQAQATTGTDTTTEMSPARTMNAIDSRTHYGVTTGTATALILNLAPAPASLFTGLTIKIKLHVSISASNTINVNGLGAKNTYMNSSMRWTSGGAGSIYTFVYDGANFILASGGGDDSKLNVFVQTSQPTTKEGIWVAASIQKTGVIMADKVWNTGTIDSTSETNLPFSGSYICAGSYNNNLYMVNGYLGDQTYMYNTTSKTYSQLPNCPNSFSWRGNVTVGKYLYVIGGANGSSVAQAQCCRLDMSNNTWSTIANLPVARHSTFVTHVNGKIYCIGGASGGTTYTTMYVYDINTNTWTNVGDVPMYGNIGGNSITSITSYGTKIYAINTSNSYSGIKEYDTVLGTWNVLSKNGAYVGSWYNYGARILAVDGILYISDQAQLYSVDLSTLALTTISNSVGYPFLNHALIYSNSKVYLVGGSTRIITYTLSSDNYPSGRVILVRTTGSLGAFTTELLSTKETVSVVGSANARLGIPIDNVYFSNGKITDSYRIYYGNGSSWVLLK